MRKILTDILKTSLYIFLPYQSAQVPRSSISLYTPSRFAFEPTFNTFSISQTHLLKLILISIYKTQFFHFHLNKTIRNIFHVCFLFFFKTFIYYIQVLIQRFNRLNLSTVFIDRYSYIDRFVDTRTSSNWAVFKRSAVITEGLI